MHGRPKLGKYRMVTVATRVEPNEVEQLKKLAQECDMSLCGYLRELIRKELSRADRATAGDTDSGCTTDSLSAAASICDAVA